jgi:FlaA1/EpsC-like NDP-sugar epimerase
VSLDGKRVLVTGGTGSLGKAVVTHLLAGSRGRPSRVTVLSRDEAKQHEMRLHFLGRRPVTDEVIYENAGKQLHFRIGDVRDLSTMVDAVRGVHVVIHIAALKQVPTCEYHPLEAVQTNVLGADVLARAVRTSGQEVEAVVGISTDKACKPVNVMGMTKAIMERVLVEANLDSPRARFVVVRYGNVVGSRGSVIPLFLDQIVRGGPVTVTAREMTRFMLSLEQAAGAVFDALEGARPGEIYVRQAPSARVVDLARALMDGRDVPLVFTGIRPGEKVHEIMVSEEECHRAVARGEYYVICPMLPELQPERPVQPSLSAEYSSADVTLEGEALRALLGTMMSRGLVAESAAP